MIGQHSQDSLTQVKSQLPSFLHDHLHAGWFGIEICHPFCRARFLNALPHEWGVGRIASAIAAKEAKFAQLCDAGDWEGALFVVERPYRAEYLSDLMEKFGAERLITAVNFVWTDAANVSNDEEAFDLWRHIWWRVSRTRAGKDRRRRFHVMDASERQAFNALPDRLTVYRGYSVSGNDYGYSWTLDRAKAEWFARRYAASPEADGVFVASMEVSKNEVLAHFTGRNEAEIVVKIWGIESDRIQVEALHAAVAQAA